MSDFNFNWIIENEIGGCSYPSTYDLQQLKSVYGVKLIVSLTENPLFQTNCKKYNIPQIIHVPVIDFSVPTVQQVDFVVSKILNKDNRPAVIHCLAGLGRTGTMIACVLMKIVHGGLNPKRAIEIVRKKRHGSIITKEQEDFVYAYGNKKT